MTDAHNNFLKCGHHQPFWNFCSGNKDTYNINEVVGKQPGRMEFMDKRMPDHSRMEDAGIGGGSADDASARRAEGKRKAKEERAAAGRVTKKISRDRDIQQTTDMAVKGAMGCLSTMLGSVLGPEKSKTQDEREGFEKSRARLELKDATYKSYLNCRRSLEDEEAKGDRASAIFVKTLKRDVQEFEEAMAKDLEDGI